MKLDNPITLRPPKFTDKNNQLVSPEPIVLDKLEIIYIDNPQDREYYITINHVPAQIMLFRGEDYNNVPDITKEMANAKLLAVSEGNLEQFLQKAYPKTLEDDQYGPGTILASMFSAIGIKSTPTCSCRRHALEMNKQGIKWCEENIETICGWLKEECEKRKIPYVDTVAKLVVNRAIAKSKKYQQELANATS